MTRGFYREPLGRVRRVTVTRVERGRAYIEYFDNERRWTTTDRRGRPVTRATCVRLIVSAADVTAQ